MSAACVENLSHSKPVPSGGAGLFLTPVLTCPMRSTVHLPGGGSHVSVPSFAIWDVRFTTAADLTYAPFDCTGAARRRRRRSVQHASPSQLSFFAALRRCTVRSVIGCLFFTVSVKRRAVVSRQASDSGRASCQLDGGRATSSTSVAPSSAFNAIVVPGSNDFVTEARLFTDGSSSVRTVTGSANS